jgi:DNA modification methylase
LSLQYDKKGKAATTKKLLDKVDYSVKEKYGFIPTSVVSPVMTDELKQYVQDHFGEVNEALVDEFQDVMEDLVAEALHRMETKYGRIPKSIENFSISKEQREYIDDDSIVKRVVPNGGIAKNRGGGFAANYNYSTFNPALAEFLLKQYFEPDTTIFDPFAGRSTRALMANKNKINYHGWDVSALTIKINENKLADLEESAHPFFSANHEAKYTLGDGTKLDGVAPNTYDGALTCPPYFNIEKYESATGQLSDHKKYKDFLEHYKQGFARYYDVIKPSKNTDSDFHPFVIVTANFRVAKDVIDFTGDTRKAAEAAGFELYDEIQHQNNSPFVYLRSRQNEARKMVAKTHETVSIFIKKDPSVKHI